MPAASLRIIPALSISLWLTSSASAGVSFSVWRWNCDRRIGGIIILERPLIVPCSRCAAGRPAAAAPEQGSGRAVGPDRRRGPRARGRALGGVDAALGRAGAGALH